MNFLTHGLLVIPRFVLVLMLTVTTSLTYALGVEKPISEQNTVSSEKIILVMGDSISAGLGIDPKEGWVALLGKSLNQRTGLSNSTPDKYRIINASISGETTSGGRNRLPRALKKYRPGLVIIELGGNDGLRGTPIKNIADNLSEMVRISQKSGAKVMLLGMRIPPNYGERYTGEFAAIYSSLAKTNNTLFVPFLLQGIAGNAAMMQDDGIHPTQLGQPVMAALVREQVLIGIKIK